MNSSMTVHRHGHGHGHSHTHHTHPGPYPTASTHPVPLPSNLTPHPNPNPTSVSQPDQAYQPPQYQYQHQQYPDHNHQQQQQQLQQQQQQPPAAAFSPFQFNHQQQPQPPSQSALPPLPPQHLHLHQPFSHPSAAASTAPPATAALAAPAPPASDNPSGVPLPPAYREKVQQLKAILLDRKNWKVCRGTPTSSHKVPAAEFDAGELVCRNCKQHDPKFFLEPEQADAKIKELLSSEPCHFVPRYDQAGCGVDRDRPNYDSKDWTTWALKPNSRGTVLRERLWQCCLGGGRKAAAKYRAGQAKNTTKIGCPRSLYAVTRWDAQEQCAKLVEIYFKHKHLPECYEHASVRGGVAGGDE